MKSLTREQNELLTQTGPGTPMGQLYREYWMPAFPSDRVEPEGNPYAITLLGERLVAFRDREGNVGMLDEACPHRGTSLALGRNEDCGLRCIYHGWKMDAHGNVLETPPEPPASAFARSVKTTAYPTREAGGVVWTYMGEAEKPPPFPATSLEKLGTENVWPIVFRQQSNYLQGLDGDVDAAHAVYLHWSEGERERQKKGNAHYRFLSGPRPGVGVQETSWGLQVGMAWEQLDNAANTVYWVTPFLPPTYRVFDFTDERAGFDGGALHAWVPIDDENHYVWTIMWNSVGPLTDEVKAAMDESQGFTDADPDNGYRARLWNGDGYPQDRQSMRTGTTYAGIHKVHLQDLVVQHSMGPIVDRTKENLATEDLGVDAVRKYLLHALDVRSSGKLPPGVLDGVDICEADRRWVHGPTEWGLARVLKDPSLVGDQTQENKA